MANCKYFEICNLQGRSNDKPYCILHDPRRNKDHNEFNQGLHGLIRRDTCDFRNVTFPEGLGFDGSNRTFSKLLNFEGSVLDGNFNVSGATLEHGLLLTVEKIHSVNLAHATVHGLVKIEVAGDIDNFSCEGAQITSSLSFSANACQRIVVVKSEIKDQVQIITKSTVRDAFLGGAKLYGGLEIKCQSIGTLNLDGAEIAKIARIHFVSGNIHAASCRFEAKTTIEAKRISELNLSMAQLDGLLSVTAKIDKLNCRDAKVKDGITFQNCDLGGDEIPFEQVTFAESSVLGLSGTTIEGNLQIGGTTSNPKTIILDGCTVKKDTTIRAELGRPAIKISAQDKRPDFRGAVSFENVSLAQCRLLGNQIKRIEMRNVQWNLERDRATLYDEIVLRKNPAVVKSLKEAYQVLKEQYRALGDHVTSGHFHYGEMEMKRREYGLLRRNLGLTGLYYALSGYGTKPAAAFRFLCYLLLLFTCLFALGKENTLARIFAESVELTLQAASFQPLTATQLERLSIYLRLVFLIARIVIPLQAGLLALAIRMRLKR